MNTDETHYLIFRQKNIRTKKKHGNRKFDKSYYSMCL